jgi:uncharacterized protein (TIGR00106 family)
MSVLLEFAMFPTDKGASVSPFVSQVVALIRERASSYQLTPMGTIIETDSLDQALDIVRACAELLDEAGCERIYSSLKLDIRRGETDRLAAKVQSVTDKIGAVNH